MPFFTRYTNKADGTLTGGFGHARNLEFSFLQLLQQNTFVSVLGSMVYEPASFDVIRTRCFQVVISPSPRSWRMKR